MPTPDGITWFDPIHLTFEADETRFLRALRKQLRDAIAAHAFSADTLKRCVYIIRMRGSVLVSYPSAASPVLYIGRGDAPSRLASHLARWLADVRTFGVDVGIELRICVPRRRNRFDFYKNVEADLIHWFQRENGAIPFFNARRERKWENKADYRPTQLKMLHRATQIGSGNKHRWAIRPLASNPNHRLFNTGRDTDEC